MSDSNRVGVRIGKHPAGFVPRLFPITSAQTPATVQSLRLTGLPNFGFVPNVVDSNEFRADRQKNKSKLVGFEAGGTVAIEFSPLTFDTVIESAMFSTWTNTLSRVGTGGSDDIVSIDDDATITVEGGAGTLTDIFPSTVLFVEDSASGFAEAYEVTAIAANSTNTALTLAHIGPSDTDPGISSSGDVAAATASLTVCGFRAQAADEISITAVSGNLATITFLGAVATADGAVFGSVGSETGLVPGLWIKLSGFTTNPSVNNVWTRIVSVGADSIVVETPTGSQAMVVEDAGPDGVGLYFGDYIRNGVDDVTDHQFYVERRFEDQSDGGTSEVTIGAIVNQLTLTLTPQSIMVGNIEFFGLNARTIGYDDRVSGTGAGTDDTSIFANGVTPPTDVDAPDEDVLNTSTDIANVATDYENLITGTENFPLNVSITINNNGRRRVAVGFQGAASIGVGEFTATGNIDTYFDSLENLAAVQNNTTKRFNMTAQDPNTSRSFVVDTPSISYTGGNANVPGKNTDTTLPVPFAAFLDDTLGYTMHIQRGKFSE